VGLFESLNEAEADFAWLDGEHRYEPTRWEGCQLDACFGQKKVTLEEMFDFSHGRNSDLRRKFALPSSLINVQLGLRCRGKHADQLISARVEEKTHIT